MLTYVSDKLRIPPAQLSKARLRQRLEELRVEPDHIERFLGMLQTAERALYAGQDNAAAMERSYQDAVQILEDIEAGET